MDVSNVLQQVITIAINIHFSNKLFINDLMSFYRYKKYKGLDEYYIFDETLKPILYSKICPVTSNIWY